MNCMVFGCCRPTVLLAGFFFVILIAAELRAEVDPLAEPVAAELSGALQASDGWMRVPPPGVSVTAGYLVLHNNSDAEQEVVTLSSSRAERVELHSHTHVDGVMRMRKIDSYSLAAGESLTLKPGGYHLMLFGIDQSLQPGESVPIEIHTASGSVAIATLLARSARGSKKE